MRTSGSQKDALGIESGLVPFCGNDHHNRILSVRVMPLELEMSKRVTKINMEPTKVSVFPYSQGAWRKTTWEQ